jgi:hypothetical protein
MPLRRIELDVRIEQSRGRWRLCAPQRARKRERETGAGAERREEINDQGEARQPEGPARSQRRYPGIQLVVMICDMPCWSWIPEGAQEGAREAWPEGQAAPPEEALTPEGQGHRNEEGVALSPGC